MVHSEADDSKSGNTVSLLDSFRKKSDNYLRLDIDTYGKKVNTNKNADGSSHSDGVVYTLEGWSHYVSPSNNKVNAKNAGYHRAGDRVTVTVCGSYQYKVTTHSEITDYTTNRF